MPGLSSVARKILSRASATFMDKIIYRNDPRFRHMAFEVRSRHEPLMISGQRELYVIRGGDEWIGRHLFVEGEYDFGKLEKALELVGQRGRSPKTLIDVGANIGSICIPAVARGLFDRAIAIEPDPDNVRLLRANSALNDCQDTILVIPIAAGDTDGQIVRLAKSSFNFGDNRVVAGDLATDDRDLIEVPCETINSVCAEVDPTETMLWMDIQGYEGFALLGADRFTRANSPIVIEFEPAILSQNGGLAPLLRSLKNYQSFIDLAQVDIVRPIGDLAKLMDEVSSIGATDILLL